MRSISILTLLYQMPILILRNLSVRVIHVNMPYTLFRKKLINFFSTSHSGSVSPVEYSTRHTKWRPRFVEVWKFQDNGVQILLLCNIKWNYLPLLFFFLLTLSLFFCHSSPQKRISFWRGQVLGSGFDRILKRWHHQLHRNDVSGKLKTLLTWPWQCTA